MNLVIVMVRWFQGQSGLVLVCKREPHVCTTDIVPSVCEHTVVAVLKASVIPRLGVLKVPVLTVKCHSKECVPVMVLS